MLGLQYVGFPRLSDSTLAGNDQGIVEPVSSKVQGAWFPADDSDLGFTA